MIRTTCFSMERADAAAIDPVSGEFSLTVATDGEASDGHILSIEGAVAPRKAPLLLSHLNDPRAVLGSVTAFHRDLSGTPKRLRALARIELGGDGPTSDERRDLAHMIR